MLRHCPDSRNIWGGPHMTRGVRAFSSQRVLYHLAAAGKIPSEGRKVVSTKSKTRMWIIDYFALLGSWISLFSMRNCGIWIDGLGSCACNRSLSRSPLVASSLSFGIGSARHTLNPTSLSLYYRLNSDIPMHCITRSLKLWYVMDNSSMVIVHGPHWGVVLGLLSVM